MTAGITFERVRWDDPRAAQLRQQMMAELTLLYPWLEKLSAPGTAPDIDPATVVATILASSGGRPVGHAAIRRSGNDLEVKRVFVCPAARGTGLGGVLMGQVEAVAVELGVRRLVLHTGDRQPAAVRMYRRLGYTPIPLFEPYATNMPGSFCFEKTFAARR